MDRSLWLKNVLGEIAEFASGDFQQTAWADFSGPAFATFEEASRCLFDDCGLAEVLADPYRLEPGERQVLSHFVLTLAVFDETCGTQILTLGESYAAPAALMAQPEWQNVRAAALAVLRHFRQTGFPDIPHLPVFIERSPAPTERFWEA